MNWVIVEETMLLPEGCKWDMCDEVDTQLNRMSLHVGGTFAVECCFQRQQTMQTETMPTGGLMAESYGTHPSMRRC